MTELNEYVLRMHCPDRPGILAAATAIVNAHGGDVRDAMSFGDEVSGEFFIRMHLKLPAASESAALQTDLADMARHFALRWELHDLAVRPRMLIAVSKYDHCLIDLLHRWHKGNLRADIPLIVSNHDDARRHADWHDIDYAWLPVEAGHKEKQEDQLLALIDQHRIDLVVLARYMQVLSPKVVSRLSGRCINIHHSFLPSFKGAMPYRQAHRRGVKLIGATAHYVTDDLDEGPIIEQDVRRVTHATSAHDMAAIGRETESSVLARAVKWHLDRILLHGSRTVVFA